MTTDTILSLYQHGALIPACILALYLGLKWGSTRFAWLEAPNRAHCIAIVLGGLAVLAVPASQGTTPNASMLLVAIVTALSLLAPGLSGATSAPAAKQSGFIRRDLLAVMVVSALAAACSIQMSCSASQKAAEKQALSCVETDAINDIVPAVKAILAAGAATWEAQLDALGIKFGTDSVGCAVTLAEQFFASGGSGSAVATTSAASADALARATQYLQEHYAARAAK
jgi:hypothetical protein